MNFGLWMLALSLLGADILSKYWTQKFLPLMHNFSSYPYGGIGIFENFLGVQFSITHLTNKGAAWGTLGHYQFPLLLFRILLICALLLYLKSINRQQKNFLPFMLITVGAIGNVLDYFLYGHVIDMFYFALGGYSFPVFNIADSAVTIGIGWQLLLSLLPAYSAPATK